jgi:hypothetical protein
MVDLGNLLNHNMQNMPFEFYWQLTSPFLCLVFLLIVGAVVDVIDWLGYRKRIDMARDDGKR